MMHALGYQALTRAPATARGGDVQAGGEGAPPWTAGGRQMAGVVVAVVLISLIFLIGVAIGVVVAMGLSTHRRADGPGPRGGGQGSRLGDL